MAPSASRPSGSGPMPSTRSRRARDRRPVRLVPGAAVRPARGAGQPAGPGRALPRLRALRLPDSVDVAQRPGLRPRAGARPGDDPGGARQRHRQRRAPARLLRRVGRGDDPPPDRPGAIRLEDRYRSHAGLEPTGRRPASIDDGTRPPRTGLDRPGRASPEESASGRGASSRRRGSCDRVSARIVESPSPNESSLQPARLSHAPDPVGYAHLSRPRSPFISADFPGPECVMDVATRCDDHCRRLDAEHDDLIMW